ncbi:MAG: ATP-binding protein [Bacteroidetes bacterium]|nr:ATP-binding protein [Bacteroidota bacterium]
MIKRIAIIGPESSGKSELSRALAAKYETGWVPEYAREYLTGLGQPYSESDVIAIYRKQWDQE